MNGLKESKGTITGRYSSKGPPNTKELPNPVIQDYERSKSRFVSGKIKVDPYSYTNYPIDSTRHLSQDQWDSMWERFLKEFTLNHSHKAVPEMIRDAQKRR